MKCRWLVSLTTLTILLGCGQSAHAQSNQSQLYHRLRVCLARGFNLEADCQRDSCEVRREARSGDFAVKVDTSARKLRDVWVCFEACMHRQCFPDVQILELRPLHDEVDRPDQRMIEIGVRIVGRADLAGFGPFECDVKATTFVDSQRAPVTSNSLRCRPQSR